MGDQRHKRKYVAGELRQLTPEWKSAVIARLGAIGQTKSWLAEQVGADKSAITVLLRPATTVSRLVAPVSTVLEIPLPLIGASLDESDIIEMVGRLDEDDRAMAIDFIKRLGK